ncbi:mevalonate kinase [Lactobacillus sp. PSON]|uniref:mevalonate kinase n=1 Tax=Lactobacillus sp. PSON TaxID=3455454 RepID=UPI00404345B3
MKSSFLAHGKVILIGEHSVVYGMNALAMPITALHIQADVEKSDETWMDTANYHGPFFEAPNNYDGLKYVVKTMMDLAKSKAPIKVTYTGEIPMERGFGSSATVALATTCAMDKFYQLNLPEAKIMEITNHAEMINHGKASGLDAATVNSDYLVFFNKEDGPQKLEEKLNATLLIMDTGELGNTKEAVGMVRKQLETNIEANKKIERLGELADLTMDSWHKQDRKAIGQYFNEAEDILASFGLATKRIEQLQKVALKNGALGFKFSGGGLGGIVLALCDNQEIAKKIAAESSNLINGYWIEEI